MLWPAPSGPGKALVVEFEGRAGRRLDASECGLSGGGAVDVGHHVHRAFRERGGLEQLRGGEVIQPSLKTSN